MSNLIFHNMNFNKYNFLTKVFFHYFIWYYFYNFIIVRSFFFFFSLLKIVFFNNNLNKNTYINKLII